MTTKDSWKFPEGAIKTREEMQLILNSIPVEHPITLYGVGQMGYMEEFIVKAGARLFPPDKESVLCGGEGHWAVKPTYYKTSTTSYRKETECFFGILMGTYHIGTSQNEGSEHHRLFTNKEQAESYAKVLQDDPEYVQSVKDWHALCDDFEKEMFDE